MIPGSQDAAARTALARDASVAAQAQALAGRMGAGGPPRKAFGKILENVTPEQARAAGTDAETVAAMTRQAQNKAMSPGPSEEKKIREAAQDMEALFITQLWKEMRKSLPKGGILEGKQQEQYLSMFDEEFSKNMARQGGLGLAQVMTQQFAARPKDGKPQPQPGQGAIQGLRSTALDAAVMPAGAPGMKGLRESRLNPLQSANPLQGAQDVIPAPPPGLKAAGPGRTPDQGAAQASAQEALRRGVSQAAAPAAATEARTAGSRPGQTEARQELQTGQAAQSGRPGSPGDRPSAPGANASALQQAGRNGLTVLKAQDIQNLSSARARAAQTADTPLAASAPRPQGLAGTPSQHLNLPGQAYILEGRAGQVQLGGGLSLPVEGELTSDFGWRKDPFTGLRAWHAGIDIAAPEGTPVKAAGDGTVVFSGRMHGYGNLVVVEHAGGMRTYYGHNKVNQAAEGQKVRAGQVLAEVGQTGRATGPHLHFEVRMDDRAVDPAKPGGTLLAAAPDRRNAVPVL